MRLALAVAAAIAAAPAAAEYRCPRGANGYVVIQQEPCDPAPVARTAPPPALPLPAAVPAAPDPYVLQREAGMGRVVVGQTAEQVKQAWGNPRAVTTMTTSRGSRQQWAYSRADGDAYVYVEGGRVASVDVYAKGAPPDADFAARPQLSPEQEAAAEREQKAANRRFIAVGATVTQVLALAGRPDSQDFIIGGELWTYRPTLNDQSTVTRVTFHNGTVFDVKRDVRY